MREEDLSFFEENEFKEALAAYENMIQGNGSAYLDADELTDIAEYYMIHHREHEAKACINYALELHPDSVDPQVFLAREQMFNGNIKKAWSICDLIENQDDREVQFLKAELLMRERKPQEAYEYLNKILATLKHGKRDFLKDSIEIFLDYAFFEEPIPLIETLLEENPYDIQGWMMMAEAQSGKNCYDEAIEATDYVLAIQDREPHAMLMKANALFQTDKAEDACLLYKEYCEICSDDEAARFLYAVCLISLEKYMEAKEILEALESSEDETIQRQTLPYRCICYLNLGDWEKYLYYLPIAVGTERDLTAYLLESYYPGMAPEEFYDYTYNRIQEKLQEKEGLGNSAPLF